MPEARILYSDAQATGRTDVIRSPRTTSRCSRDPRHRRGGHGPPPAGEPASSAVTASSSRSTGRCGPRRGHQLLFEAYAPYDAVATAQRRAVARLRRGDAQQPAAAGGAAAAGPVAAARAAGAPRRQREALLQRAVDASMAERRRIAGDPARRRRPGPRRDVLRFSRRGGTRERHGPAAPADDLRAAAGTVRPASAACARCSSTSTPRASPPPGWQPRSTTSRAPSRSGTSRSTLDVGSPSSDLATPTRNGWCSVSPRSACATSPSTQARPRGHRAAHETGRGRRARRHRRRRRVRPRPRARTTRRRATSACGCSATSAGDAGASCRCRPRRARAPAGGSEVPRS